MTSAETTKLLKGKRIVKVSLNPFPDGRGGRAHDPVILLDDGTRIRFEAEEVEGDGYGVELLVNKPSE